MRDRSNGGNAMNYYYYDPAGKVVMTAVAPSAPETPPVDGWALGEGHATVGQAMIGGVPQDRPTVMHGWAATGAAPVTLGMGALPAGTTVAAINEAGEFVTTDDPADPIILADPETYTVAINPPWPYLPETLEIELT